MPTNKQRREAAQRRLQRQLERRGELARKRRRNLLAGVAVIAVLVVVGAAFLITNVIGGNDDAAASGSTAASSSTAASNSAAATTAAAAATNADGTVACDYQPDTSGNTNLKDVGTPPNPAATLTQGTSTLLMSTGQGDLTLTLDRAKAPCAAASFTYLAQQGFFDGSPCHREVNQDTFGVLQCGDPSGTGSGGPSYKYAEEVSATTTYPRGTIAMAKTNQPNTTGSQFFLCFVDTNLPPQYTVVGTVDEAGLGVLDEIAAAGNNGVNGAGDGAPNVPVTITKMTVLQ
ncbi:peptidyl-prolyl cis-trans isomerase B (cyclophilin B) [Modestobacter sp. DSM 44400]|uniref:peptidylprolyl isomerase n=1 Tax=Modestobacter sp. DSM 44400 TaxID=1550230 RepID=UPI0008997928|nr:peptidylprolyl isomerase [Modestobacter sp. DSM 44400]SDX61853.1 peptidyl-prolyl cis-trans isomerase B (cyclophilin B) [Modestobacter sp. DSM 44400]